MTTMDLQQLADYFYGEISRLSKEQIRQQREIGAAGLAIVHIAHAIRLADPAIAEHVARAIEADDTGTFEVPWLAEPFLKALRHKRKEPDATIAGRHSGPDLKLVVDHPDEPSER